MATTDKCGGKRLKSGRFGPGNPGRPKGAKGKVPQAIKEMFRQALDEEGGVKYLRKLAKTHPVAFSAAISRMIPNKVDVEQPRELIFRHPDIVARGQAGALAAVKASEERAEAEPE